MDSTAKIDGTIEFIGEEKHVSEKFNVREIVINTGGQYPQFIKCQLVNQKCDLIIGKRVGQPIIADANLRGRKGKDKQGKIVYYTSIDIWRIN